MPIVYSILFFLVGLAIGSFLNVVILRIDELATILYDRSHCPKCKKVLSWFELIPLLSFMLLRGRCKQCNQKISWQYPLVEFGVGLLFLLLYLSFGLSWGLLFYLIVFSILTVVFVYDIKTQTVPEVFVWIVLILSLLTGWHFGGFTLFSGIVGAVIAGGFLGALVFFSKESWMGSGDVKLGVILGLLTGYPNVLVALFSAFVFGSLIGIAAILFQGKKIDKRTLKTALPFAPFLILGILFALLYGSAVIAWYSNLYIAY